MGQLENIVDDGSCDRFLHPYDIIGMVHTGIYDVDAGLPVISSAHECIFMRNRPLSPRSGGTACFVRKHLKKHVTMIADKIEHGVVWFRIGCPRYPERGLFVGFVYLPPQASSYYTQVNGTSYDEHWLMLQQDIL